MYINSVDNNIKNTNHGFENQGGKCESTASPPGLLKFTPGGRVGAFPYGNAPLDEPCVRVSPHTALAIIHPVMGGDNRGSVSFRDSFHICYVCRNNRHQDMGSFRVSRGCDGVSSSAWEKRVPALFSRLSL